MCAPRSGLELTPSGQCYCALVQAVSQPLYPFGHAGIMYTANDITTLLNPLWKFINVKVNFSPYRIIRKTELLQFLLG